MFQAAKDYPLLCAALLLLFGLFTFPAASGQSGSLLFDDDNTTSCLNVSSEVCCNTSVGSPCALCEDSNSNKTCKITCENGETNTCPAAPITVAPITCDILNTSECCNFTATHNCSLCLDEAGGAEAACKVKCDAGERDTCVVPQPTTTPTTPGTTPNTTSTTPGTTPGKGGSSGQSFDGASFVGGIILSLGIVAIVFFGLKFYKARKDQNYHTL